MTPRRRTWLAPAVVVTLFVLDGPAAAQTFTLAADFTFYGDNTEFVNQFRSGETLLGTAGRIYLDLDLNETTTLRAGFFGNGRYGSHEFLEEAEPLIALALRHGPSTFLFGSLETAGTRMDISGPDVETPHGLLPPIERETLTFTRAHEMGLQWIVAAPRMQHDAWINWQRLNTRNHRERFDAGYRMRGALSRRVAVHGQWHVVHEGGQQFSNGPVRDSQAGALGLEWAHAAGDQTVRIDAYAVGARDVPDRQRPERTENGAGVFLRGAVEHRLWRTHLIVWRSRHMIKEEGDANYLMVRRDGRLFWKVRDYGELGLTRHFHPAPGVGFDASVRLHRTESHYEYSYRLIARVQLRRKL